MQTAPKKELSVFDSVCLITGIIIGAGIYQVSPNVAKGAGSVWALFAIWIAGGLLSLFGALGYAELASAYPRQGGDYVFLSRAYGSWAGFLFGWIQLVIVRPGDIAGMAFIFANYARVLYDPFTAPYGKFIYACGAVLLLTIINVLRVKAGKWTQNLLTTVKALGLLGIVAVAIFAPSGQTVSQTFEPFPVSVALILVLFTFGGWNEMAYVAAEVKNPGRNIVRSLVIGTAAVTALYLLANAAFLRALGFAGLASSEAVASDTVSTVFHETGANIISALICISTLGAANGLIFTGARISYAVGSEHRLFRLLGKWNPQTGTPVGALLVQGIIAVIVILVLGSFTDTVLYCAAVVYCFYLATSVAVFVLRVKEPNVPRPYKVSGPEFKLEINSRVPGYRFAAFPLATLIFCVVCGFLIYGAVNHKPLHGLIALGILLAGLPVYFLSRFMGRS